MCSFCENGEIMLSDNFINPSSWGWGGDYKITEGEATKQNVGVFIDRGYLRLVDLEDCQCIEGGEKARINFCPVCGEKIEFYC